MAGAYLRRTAVLATLGCALQAAGPVGIVASDVDLGEGSTGNAPSDLCIVETCWSWGTGASFTCVADGSCE